MYRSRDYVLFTEAQKSISSRVKDFLVKNHNRDC